MNEVEWRKITWDNVHDHVGKPVRVFFDSDTKGAWQVSGILESADRDVFVVADFGHKWSDASLFYAWYPARGNITLTDPIEIKRFVENMDKRGVGKYVR